MEILAVMEVVLAIAATVYLFITGSKCAKGLRLGFLLMGFGTAVLSTHALIELFSEFGHMGMNTLMIAMEISISISSVLLLSGTYFLYKTISEVGKKSKRR